MRLRTPSTPIEAATPRSPRRLGVLAVASALALTLGACTGDDGDDAKAGASTTTEPIVAATIKPTTPQREIPAEKDIVEVPALREDITLASCAAVDGGWAGTGTAKNTSKEAKTFHILVFFTDQYSRTIDYAETDVKVAAGTSVDWTAKRDFDPPKDTKCVLRGLSQTPA